MRQHAPRLDRALLAAWVVIILMVVAPWWSLQDHAHWDRVVWLPFTGRVRWLDVVLNVLLYVPFGYLHRRAGQRSPWRTAMYAGVLSLVTEAAQVYSHGRFPSATDLVANVSGAWLGGWMATLVRIRAFALPAAVLLLMPGPIPVAAQDRSVVIGAIGADAETTAAGGALLDAVGREIERHGVLSVRDRVQGLRVELPPSAVFSRTLNLGASGAAVLQVHATAGRAGYAHLWVAPVRGAPGERIEPVDVSGDLTVPARSLAAAIISTMTGGAYHLVEFHVFTWPRAVTVAIAGAAAGLTDRPGREPGEGFGLWTAVRPAGDTLVRLSRPGYRDRVVPITVPAGTGDLARVLVEVSLTPSEP